MESRFKKTKTLSFGQPTFKSHPEFFRSESDIIPGVTQEEFRQRRKSVVNLATKVATKGEKTKDLHHMIIIPASTKKYMSENIPYPFRQNSNFFYLSGSYDNDAFILLISSPNEQRHIMFLGDPDPVGDLWDGPKTSPKAAVDYFGFDEAFLTSEFPIFLKHFHNPRRSVMVWCEDRSFVEKGIREPYSIGISALENPRSILDTLRVLKSPGEIDLMKKSSQIASEAFQQAMVYCGENSQVNEHQIWAKIDYECRVRGAERLAYPPVVASGSRANVIHYVFNANKCKRDEMVLVDAGCEFFGYCSDITRTWPVSGKFDNDLHRSLYQMMLELQCDIIKQVRPGITLDQLFQAMGVQLIKGLQDLGIISQSLDVKSTSAVALRFCPHHVSHYLGMDVHDTPTIERNESLLPGMIITVEPGVYIRTASNQKEFLTKVGREFEGIAIRIEDDVLVTDDGSCILTAECPKTIADIELWSGKGLLKANASQIPM
ncbi:unnamed protein product [Allacma fusca]|uniref:Aminopeptidase P N-terminal domain-containing protein n=1 Tax=Allacma fusca TaxID=39272 RepID=A0A8J2LNB1_9HEXA|nr:unnamed protein product [Allacma fusca]